MITVINIHRLWPGSLAQADAYHIRYQSNESIKALLWVLGGHWPLLGAATSSWRPLGLKIAH